MSSRTEQQDIEALLLTMSELANIAVLANYRGVTDSEIESALAGALVKSGRISGAVILVMQPVEQPDRNRPTVPVFLRTHTVRVIEQVKVNNLPDGTYVCGLNGDSLKDLVIQRLHNRHLGRASLVFAGTEPFTSDRGGVGYDVNFTIFGELGSEIRAANPIVAIAANTCTITGAGASGEVIYYTIDGTAPVVGGDSTLTYSAPFAVASGVTVRAATIAAGKALSHFIEATNS